MKKVLFLLVGMIGAIVPTVGHAAPQLSSERLEVLDRRGYFTPAFKEAVHHLVEAQQGVVQAQEQTKKFQDQLPKIQQQANVAQAGTVLLQRELDTYIHSDELDFTDLQSKMKDPATSVTEKTQLAQGFIWAYPASPHQSEAQQNLQQLQTKLAAQEKSSQAADAARASARASLQQRAQAKALTLAEWKEFLQDMSQEDVLKSLGHPQSAGDQFWIYRGDWTSDPVTQQKVGLMVSFNGARVNTVTEAPPVYSP